MDFFTYMEITIILLIVFYLYFTSYVLSKEELKRFTKKDNWSNMGF